MQSLESALSTPKRDLPPPPKKKNSLKQIVLFQGNVTPGFGEVDDCPKFLISPHPGKRGCSDLHPRIQEGN